MNLDIEHPDDLLSYLRHSGKIEKDERPEISVLQGGVSNKTMLVKRESGETRVVRQALEKLRVNVDWFSDPARIHREALGLRYLAHLIPEHVPQFMFEDVENHILAMSAVPEPHYNWKTVLLSGGILQHHVKGFAELLGRVHRQAYERRTDFAEFFADTSFFESLRLEPYYLYTASQVVEAAPFLETLVEETKKQQLTLVHGDYSPKNILIYQNKLILLDYEVIHWGDPAFDIGFGMTHLLSKAHYLAEQRSTFLNAAWVFWKSYSRIVKGLSWSKELEPRAVRHTLACMLARVRGRSPLEYLNDSQCQHQEKVILALMSQSLMTFDDVFTGFAEGLENASD